MTTPSTTRFVQSGGGYENPAESGVRGAIWAKAGRIPRVDGVLGRELPPDPADTTLAPASHPPTPAESAVQALAVEMGIDPGVLLDSASLMAAAEAVDPADLAGVITEAIGSNPRLAQVAPPAGMKPNPAQGAPGSTAPAAPVSVRDSLKTKAGAQLEQPLPPGFTA